MATDHLWPNGSATVPQRSPQNWSATGISPFISTSESLTLGVLMAVLLYLVLQFSAKQVRPLGVLVMPVAFVLLGWAGTLMKEVASTLAPALQSGWIWVHIVGASGGFASVLIAAGLGLLYLLKQRPQGPLSDRLPPLEALDALSYRFVVGGFTLYGVMIVSGAFWANQVKGTFWNWDPVEVWSLISWLIYGIYLHLRITFGWRGRRLAIYSLAAAAASLLNASEQRLLAGLEPADLVIRDRTLGFERPHGRSLARQAKFRPTRSNLIVDFLTQRGAFGKNRKVAMLFASVDQRLRTVRPLFRRVLGGIEPGAPGVAQDIDVVDRVASARQRPAPCPELRWMNGRPITGVEGPGESFAVRRRVIRNT